MTKNTLRNHNPSVSHPEPQNLECNGMFAGGALIAIKEPLVKGSSLILVSLNLGSFVNDAKNHVLNHVDIWVMKDYGVKEYWVN
ncbi:hypothetical protein RDI58_020607 [Solanum bulbocastanum]|uniref:Uncharacterized protein n=1 Tax=Solanum bulbocastanum TaxID=147425 RepID=A0AAN8TFJ7_SOLBU